ncbi:MAG: tetratricopeptide repeat protein [Chthoniobacterales bacterium]
MAKKPTDNPEAHRLYLLGRYKLGKYSEAGWTSSIRYYEQALKLDPNYARAYCGLADTYAYMGGVVMSSKEAVVKEKEFAQRAIQLDRSWRKRIFPSPSHSAALLIDGTPKLNSTAPSN